MILKGKMKRLLGAVRKLNDQGIEEFLYVWIIQQIDHKIIRVF